MVKSKVDKGLEEKNNVHIHGFVESEGFDYDKYKKEILEKIKLERSRPSERKLFRSRIYIPQEVKKRKEEIENDDLEQNIKLKKYTLYILFGFLAFETIFLFLFAYWQATYSFGFYLEEWSFNLLVAATISQITYMMQVAVRHLFPNKK